MLQKAVVANEASPARVKNLETRDRLVGVGGGIRASIGNASCRHTWCGGAADRSLFIFLRDDEHLILLGGEFLGEFGFANAAVHSDLGELLGNVGIDDFAGESDKSLDVRISPLSDVFL
jgi:hypothetical protein